MNPLLAAGVLAAAHKLGIMPESPIVASILGYLAGHQGPGDDTEHLKHQLGQSQQREHALRHALAQQQQQQHQQAQLQAVLQAAQEASRSR